LSHETLIVNPPLTVNRRGLVSPAPAQELFTNIGHIKEGLSAITGLAFKHDVPYALIGKDQLHRYLEQRLRETMKPEDARAEELTLKMLGLAPADFDLRKNTLDLLTEQAAAFYDYNQKKLFVLEGSGGRRRGAYRAGSRIGARAGRSALSPGEIHP
jgi:hypothetical protein